MSTDWRPVFKDDEAAFLYTQLSILKNSLDLPSNDESLETPTEYVDKRDELMYLETILYKLEKKALDDLYKHNGSTILAQRWLEDHGYPPNPLSTD